MMIFPPEFRSTAERLLADARNAGLKIATAESCTGGLVSALLTDIPGSSKVFERGFVTYSNEAKHTLLGVPEEILRTKGSVSEDTVRAMLDGALAHSLADVAVAITGVAGPGSASPTKPAGLVYIAARRKGQPVVLEEQRFGDIGRSEVRMRTVEVALALLNLCL